LKLKDYAGLGGYMDHVRPLDSILHGESRRHVLGDAGKSLAALPQTTITEVPINERTPRRSQQLPNGRLHLHDGPIDLIIEAFGSS